MNDLPAALYTGSGGTFIDWGLTPGLAGTPPGITALKHQVEVEVHRGTARSAVKERKTTLANLWIEASQRATEMAWAQLPDRALEALEEQPDKATPDDLDFLVDATTGASAAAVAAVRLLGNIGEDSLAPVNQVRDSLVELLTHRSAAVRVAVVEALWQMAERSVTPNLAAALERESHPHVRRTIEHVIRVLG